MLQPTGGAGAGGGWKGAYENWIVRGVCVCVLVAELGDSAVLSKPSVKEKQQQKGGYRLPLLPKWDSYIWCSPVWATLF